MDASDQAIVAKVRAGDKDSFRVLVERHAQGVFRLGYRMTGNEHDAEEVVQESFLRAFRQIDRYESRASFATWIHRIAANYALDLIRARRRNGTSGSLDDQTGWLERVPSGEPSADRLVFAGQVRQQLQEAMGSLSEQERVAFLLRHYEGQSIQEISGVLGVNGNATKNSIFRAVQKLRRALAPLAGAEAGG